MNIVITGGGTGGHLSIAKALAEVFKSQGNDLIYIGSINGQDRDWFEESDLFKKAYFLNTYGVVNQKGFSRIASLLKQIQAIKKARKIFREHKIQRVLSVGGFSAGPASFGAIISGIPFFIHEQNAIKGTLNKFLSPFAKIIFGSFAHSGKNYLKTSYPVREEFFSNARVRQEVKCVIFLGGSQGARAVNDFALLVVKKLLAQGIKVIHQCGTGDYERIKSLYEKIGFLNNIELFAFNKNLVEKMTQADFCIGRAGASSVWELAANGLPCIFIPYPYAAGDHQYYNALEFQNEGLGIVVRQNDLYPQVLFDFIDRLEKKGENGNKEIQSLSEKLQAKIHCDGANDIAVKILKWSI
ncbi:undecaprenyldiphospho-muramoylpentapeptide beta-N-acetylglucosaminyltransferase [Helicobacter sp. 13S00477-4]|uniref:undecaprenyldiphospho-muramoylpentapeptide beta-N-acetylglucosaminyltransferase n=1 Tax=Helicobacter sp. 13S00477-4 TaxID=1905759 RepID=UPI000BA67E92|nr:undecaprenyldiphospho-muramoylpentapeptide beta-N-acetylglucosaminyltransferase [Helicobacter sp. 13S00477-4]PAF52328.1 undecaprenyldiphospho-muramoylpentapeptide beta-N-acetylglucosaminyltransferase [Helicobacter sp. 13S00477-4]